MFVTLAYKRDPAFISTGVCSSKYHNNLYLLYQLDVTTDDIEDGTEMIETEATEGIVNVTVIMHISYHAFFDVTVIRRTRGGFNCYAYHCNCCTLCHSGACNCRDCGGSCHSLHAQVHQENFRAAR